MYRRLSSPVLRSLTSEFLGVSWDGFLTLWITPCCRRCREERLKLLFLNVSQLQFACFEKSFIGVREILMEQFFLVLVVVLNDWCILNVDYHHEHPVDLLPGLGK